MKLNLLKKTSIVLLFIMGSAMSLKAQTATEAVDALKEAVAKSQAKDYLAAIELFKKCISIYDQLGETENENRITAISQIPGTQYKYAFGLYKEKKYDESIEAFVKLAEYSTTYNDPDNLKKANKVIPQLYYFKGKDLLDLKDYDAALIALNKSIELEFDFPNAHLRKAQLFDDKEDAENFKAAIDEALKASKNKNDAKSEEVATTMAVNFYIRNGAEAFKSGNFEKSAEFFNALLEYKDGDSDIYYQLAAIYNKLSKWDEAISSANKALELFKEQDATKDARIYFELGNALTGKEDTASACDAYNKANKGDYAAQAKYQIEVVLKCQ